MPLTTFAEQLWLRATPELKDSGRKGTFSGCLGDARWLISADIHLHWRWDSSLIKMNVVAQLCHCVPFSYVSWESFYVTENISSALVKRKLSDTSALLYCFSMKWQDTPMINRVAVTIRSSNSLAVLAAFMHWIIFLSSKLFKEQWQHAELETMCLCLLVSWLILGILSNLQLFQTIVSSQIVMRYMECFVRTSPQKTLLFGDHSGVRTRSFFSLQHLCDHIRNHN